MKTTKAHLIALTLTISAAQNLAIPARAWSPLQADSMKEIEQVPKESLRDKFFQDLIKQQQAAEEAAIEKAAIEKAASSGKHPEKNTVPHQRTTDEPTMLESTAKSTNDNLETELTRPTTAAVAESDSTTTDTKVDSEDKDSSAKLSENPQKYAKPTAGIVPKEKTIDPTYFLKRAKDLLKEQDYQSALNYTNRALELSPQCWEAWYQKALVYQLAGYDAAAARRYIKLIERKPDMLEAHVSLGTLYRKHQNLDLAAKEYRTAIELNYYSFTAHYNLANVLMDQNDLEQALKEYKVCLKIQPGNAMVHNNLGVIYQHRNYFNEAMEEFKTASHLDPANQSFTANLANAHKKIGQNARKPLQM